ncbi:hypothetical protein [Algoriphagus halophilus]|uniref:Uncharacterized protein n=1 Tax=Algoriphagus halophilus TaxID=226505 RepID=A0A1N6FYA5_9BACT|nr:hypothetical protein [Algoriphagus halophilus]SIO00170.1 hypothetical protein SAMN05444394_2820 [Algoriphagus halophilus]
MNQELEKKAEELEQTLAKQLELLKKDSEEWVKIGGLALAGGLIAFAILKTKKRKKNRNTEKALALLEKEGLLTEELEEKIKSKAKSSGFWPSLSQRLLVLGLAYAKEKYLPNLFSDQASEDAEKGEEESQ